MNWLMLVLLLAVPGRCQHEDDAAPVGGKEESSAASAASAGSEALQTDDKAASDDTAAEGRASEDAQPAREEESTAQEGASSEDEGAAAQEASSEGASDSARPEQTSSGDADAYSADDLTASVTENETAGPTAKAPTPQEVMPPKATGDGLTVPAAKRIRGPRRKAAAKKVEAAVARIAQTPQPQPAAPQFLPVPPTPFAPCNP